MELARLDELEIRMAFQEDLIDTLNGIVAAQQQEMVLLREQLRYLHQQLRELQLSAVPLAAPQQELPPHY